MIKKGKKGYTLIELLVTILIISLIVTIAGSTIVKILDTSKTQSNNISIKGIKTSASQYIYEEKNEDKYWFVTDDNIEYACTTVEVLINKGYLKQNVIGFDIEGQKLAKETSVRVERDKDTKVYKDEILFNTNECNSTNEIKLTFEVSGTHNEGYEDWYNNDVTIKIEAENENQIKEYTYFVNNEEKTLDEIIYANNNWKIIVTEEGTNIDVCVNTIDLKDKVSKFCLKDENKTYNMDKTPPTSPNLTLQTQEGYLVISNGATDNITKKEDLIYFLSKNSNNTKESANYLYAIDTYLPSGEEVISYVIDEAGNKSTTTTRNLAITDTQNQAPLEKYICLLQPNNYYDTYDEAEQVCNITGDITTKTTYYCKEDPSISSTNKDTVKRKCYKEGKITTSGGGTKTETYEVDGYSNIEFECKNGVWSQVGMNSSNYGCEGGKKTGYKCTPDPSTVAGKSCSKEGSTTTLNRDCTNYCEKEVDVPYTYYCSLGYEVPSATSSCKEAGTVKSKTSYICNLNNSEYSTEDEALDNCNKTSSPSTKYYCSLTDSYYDTNSSALDACTNNCSKGTYYNNACYTFN